MQTTLLGLGIAIILALVAALVAPLVVDWNQYRAAFESEASRLTGLDVHIAGAIDARILPTPRITLRGVEAGPPGAPARLRAASLELEIGLGPLLRGQVQASEAHLVAPDVSLGLDRSGAVDWPALAPSFRPQTLSISRLSVEDGRVTLTDAGSGATLVLQKLWFNGDVRSFIGPLHGEGTVVAGDGLYTYRITAGQYEADSGLKIRLGLEAADRPLTADLDGTVTFNAGGPQFDGGLTLARPVGVTLANGTRLLSVPWRAATALHATPAGATLAEAALQYGPDERPINLTATGTVTFGAHPHLDGTISGLQLDIDRALAAPDVTHRPPLVMAKDFAAAFAAAAKLPIPARIDLGIDAVTVGGASIDSLRGTVQYDGKNWTIDRLEFHAPGLTQVSLGGRMQQGAQGPALRGPATVESQDADALLAWLKGVHGAPSGDAKPLRAHGEVTLAGDEAAIEGLSAAVGDQQIAGRLSYRWASGDHPAALDASLRAAELDIDALAAFGKAAFADGAIELPHAGALALDIGEARFAGIAARAVTADVKFDAGALRIDRLAVGALGGAALAVKGRIDELSSQPRGQMTFDLDARSLAGLVDVVGKFAPRSAATLARFADRLAPATLHAVLTVDRAAAAASTAKLDLSGQAGLTRLALNGAATGTLAHPRGATLSLDSRFEADDATALTALFGLDRVIGVDQLPGRVTLTASGPVDGDLRIAAQAAASGFEAALQGKLDIGTGGDAPSGTFQVLASAADLRPLHRWLTGQPGVAVPASGRASLTLRGGSPAELSLQDIALTVGQDTVRGRLALDLAKPVGISGDVEADRADAVAVAAMLAGAPPVGPAGDVWSSDPIGVGAFAGLNGAVTFRLGRADLTPALAARDMTGVARFSPSAVTLDRLAGTLAAGKLDGALAFRREGGELGMHARFDLAGAQAADLLGPGAKPLDGAVTITFEADGSGESPAALVGALHGGGTVALTQAHIAGIDPAAFDAVLRAADQDGAVAPAEVAAVANTAMASGSLAVPQGEAAFTVTAGIVDLAKATLKAQNGAALSLGGTFDLRRAALDARLTLSAPPPARALIDVRPELALTLKGPFRAPARTLDPSALMGWLALHAAELQTRRLESIEADRRDGATAPAVRPDSPVLRTIPPGSVVELSDAGLSAQTAGMRAFDRLQPDATTTPTVGAHAEPAPLVVERGRSTPLIARPPPRTASPDRRSPLDLLFGRQN